MAVIQLPVAAAEDLVQGQTRLRVLVREAWADEWQECPYFQPVFANNCAAPGISRAQFRYDYGRIKREDISAFYDWDPGDFDDWYVRIMVMGDDGEWPLWTGIVSGEDRRPDGGDVADASGVQIVQAFGLELLLDSQMVDTGKVLRGTDPAVDDVYTIGRAPVFNDPGGRGIRALGNRTTSVPVNGNGEHAFQADGGDFWTGLDVCGYVVRNFSPAAIQFTMAGQLDVLDNLKMVLDPTGLNARQVLGQLIDRRRGVGYWVDSLGEQPVIRVFTTIGAPVAVGGEGGVVIPASAEQRELDLSSERLAREPRISRITISKFDRILVRGARLKVAFTVSFTDANLEALWLAAEATAYKAAAGAVAEEYDAERVRDLYERVYCCYRIPRSWDWTAGGGDGRTKYPVALTVNRDGSVDPLTSAVYWSDGRTLERQLPILAEAGATDSKAEYLKPMAFVMSPEDGHYYPVDKLVQPEDGGDDEVNDQKLDQPIPVHLLDRDTGILLKPRLPHILGLNHFDAGTPPESDTDPLYDYQTVVATLCIRTDEHLQVEELLSEYEQSENLKTMRIDVPDAEFWYVVQGTVVGVNGDNGTLDRVAAGQVKRDDGARLRQIAAMAKAYYGAVRQTASFGLRKITPEHRVGLYYTRIVSGTDVQTLGTVVTNVTWDLVRMETAVQTGWEELDLAGLSTRPALDERGMARVLARLEAKVAEQERQLSGLPLRDAQPGALATYGK